MADFPLIRPIALHDIENVPRSARRPQQNRRGQQGNDAKDCQRESDIEKQFHILDLNSIDDAVDDDGPDRNQADCDIDHLVADRIAQENMRISRIQKIDEE